MLEFIVLGQIPGTSFQITFAWVIAALLIMVTSSVLYIEVPKLIKKLSDTTTQEKQTA